ncbi:hypothetical protein SHDE107825_17900 [Shewanella denitrificans]
MEQKQFWLTLDNFCAQNTTLAYTQFMISTLPSFRTEAQRGHKTW